MSDIEPLSVASTEQSPNRDSTAAVTSGSRVVSLKSTSLSDALDESEDGDSILQMTDQIGLGAENVFDPRLKDFIHYVLYS